MSTVGTCVARTLLVLLLLPLASHAALISLSASLDGAQMVGPTGSTATGSAALTFDSDVNALSWQISFAGLAQPACQADFHGPGAAGVNAGMQFSAPGDCGTAGEFVGDTVLSGSQAADLQAGLWYILLRNEMFPAGEIRGQILVDEVARVPEPAPLALLLIGLAAVLLGRTAAAQMERMHARAQRQGGDHRCRHGRAGRL